MDCSDILDEEFGSLTVMEHLRSENVGIKRPDGKQHNRYIHYYRCKCICGQTTEVSRPNLLSGHTQSCGCLKRKKGSERPGWTGYAEISGTMWADIKAKAESRGLRFEITIEDAWAQFVKQNKCCALTGLPLTIGRTRTTTCTASLDRINNEEGYLRNNIQWLDKDVNWMKGKFSVERFVELCTYVAKHNKDQSC